MRSKGDASPICCPKALGQERKNSPHVEGLLLGRRPPHRATMFSLRQEARRIHREKAEDRGGPEGGRGEFGREKRGEMLVQRSGSWLWLNSGWW